MRILVRIGGLGSDPACVGILGGGSCELSCTVDTEYISCPFYNVLAYET